MDLFLLGVQNLKFIKQFVVFSILLGDIIEKSSKNQPIVQLLKKHSVNNQFFCYFAISLRTLISLQ